MLEFRHAGKDMKRASGAFVLLRNTRVLEPLPDVLGGVPLWLDTARRCSVALFMVIACGLAAPSLFAGPILNLAPGISGVVTTWATGLNYPVGMVLAPDGSLLVGTTAPLGGQSGDVPYYQGAGTILSFAGPNSPGTVVAGPFPGAITSIVRAGSNYLVVGTAGNGEVTPPGDRSSFTTMDMHVMVKNGATYTEIGDIHVDQNPSNSVNPAFTVVPHPGGGPNQFDLYFQVGSAEYLPEPLANAPVTGLINGQLQQGAIYRVTLTGNGNSASAGPVTQIATGVRNSFGMAIDANGNLYFGDNGNETSADTLNIIPGAATVNSPLDFGFPSSYYDGLTGILNNSYPGRQATLLAFAGATPQSGISNLALAPSAFPNPYHGGIFIAFHGNYFNANAANLENALLYYDPVTNSTSAFIPAAQASVGNLDGLLATSDSLFVADFGTGPGNFVPGTGAIYQIGLSQDSSTPEPAAFVLACIGLAALTVRAWFRRRRRHAPCEGPACNLLM